MGIDSNIAWTDHTANFWIGCTKVAQGCKFCYAENYAKRVGADVWGPTKPRRFVASAHGLVERINRAAEAQPGEPRPRVFVSSLCDFFDDPEIGVIDHIGRTLRIDPRDQGLATLTGTDEHPEGYDLLTVGHLRRAAWQTIDNSPNVDFLILTKRPGVVRAAWHNEQARANVWLGVSAATDDEYTDAMQQLDALRDLVRYTFISAEPMIEDIRPRLDGFGGTKPPTWVIVGGESGSHARPCRAAWIRKFVEARRPGAAKLFVKQLGSNVPDYSGCNHPKGGEPEEWPADLRVRELPGS